MLRRSEKASRFVALLACLLIGIRIAAALVCATCFTDIEKPLVRSFYLHSGWDQDRCHHGQAPASPWINWACSVNADDPAFVLPDVPRLPVIVALFVPLVLLRITYHNLSLVVAQNRGPPYLPL
jgi:hypothetical protein